MKVYIMVSNIKTYIIVNNVLHVHGIKIHNVIRVQ